MRPEQERRPNSPLGSQSMPRLLITGELDPMVVHPQVSTEVRQQMWVALEWPMDGDSVTCMAMCMNGWRMIFIAATMEHHRMGGRGLIRHGPRSVAFAAAAGVTSPSTAARRTESGSRRASATPTLASALPELYPLRYHCLTGRPSYRPQKHRR